MSLHHQVQTRVAVEGDAPAILALQHDWLEAGARGEKAAGYLAGTPYSASQLQACIRQSGVAVATVGDTLVGYYLFDCDSDHPQTVEYAGWLGELQSNQLIPNERVCPRVQTAIHRNWHGLGIPRALIATLASVNGHRFDAAFGVVFRDNPKLGAHLKAGWRIVAERAEVFLLTLSLQQRF